MRRAKGIITLDLAKGEEAILVPEGFCGNLVIQPLERNPESCNYYGVKEFARRGGAVKNEVVTIFGN